MSTFPKTLAALRDQEDRSWTVADALVQEIRCDSSGRVLSGEYDRCQTWLADHGYDVSADYLKRLRLTASFFSSSEERTRRWNIPFRLYMEAAGSANWTPELMDRAEAERMTLRQFSQALTGRRWSDDDHEATKRILRDPVRRTDVFRELEPEHQQDVVDDFREVHAQYRERRAEGRRGSPPNFMEIGGEITSATNSLSRALRQLQNANFDALIDDGKEYLSQQIKALLNIARLVELKIAGSTEIDWDSELAKLS